MVLCVPLMLRSCRVTTKSCYQLKAFLDNSRTTKPTWDFSRTLHVSPNLSSSTAQNLERRYTDKHEWVTSDGKIGIVGISHYAQDALGDVVYAQLPEVGSQIEQNEECGALESVKAASELYSPVSGKVIEINSAVEATPGLINQSCYEKGWLFKVELSKNDEVSALMNQIDYDKFLKSDPH